MDTFFFQKRRDPLFNLPSLKDKLLKNTLIGKGGIKLVKFLTRAGSVPVGSREVRTLLYGNL